MWDIAGQERFGNMTQAYYRGAIGAFIVYDVTRPSTFQSVSKWKNDIDAKVELPLAWGGGSIPAILLANKVNRLQCTTVQLKLIFSLNRLTSNQIPNHRKK